MSLLGPQDQTGRQTGSFPEKGNPSGRLGVADDSRRKQYQWTPTPPPGALFAPSSSPDVKQGRQYCQPSRSEAANKSSRATPESKPEDTVLGPHKRVYCRNPRAPPRWNGAVRGYPAGTRTIRGPWKETCPKNNNPRALTLNSPQLQNIDHLPLPR